MHTAGSTFWNQWKLGNWWEYCFKHCFQTLFQTLLPNTVSNTVSNIVSEMLVGLYNPVGSALECEANVLRLIHSSGELKGALRGPTTSSDPVGIMDWGGVLFMSLGNWRLWGSTIFRSRRLIKVIAISLSSMKSVSYLSCR